MIIHLTSVHKSNDIRIFHKQCLTLKSAGFDVTFIVPELQGGNSSEINIVSINSVSKSRIGRMLTTTWKVFKECVKQDGVSYHFHDPELIPIGLLLKLRGKKVIYDVHEDVPKDILDKPWIPLVFRKVVSRMFKVFENFASKVFDLVVTATPTINKRFLDLGCNAVNINNYPLLNELTPISTLKEDKGESVVYMGGIQDIRGIYEMIHAIEKTDCRLFLAGEFASTHLQTSLSQMSGWGKVDYLGTINRSKVCEILNRSLVGLVIFHPIANHIDAQPNKMFEYMSAGIPVIASNFPLWKEIIEPNNCGICVDPLDPSAIADAINWIATHPDEAEQMGLNGRVAVQNYYNWETEGRSLVKAYKELIG